jgi:3-oxoacyl-(acyl-carrier-protein) synthase
LRLTVANQRSKHKRVVITGIGLIAATGGNREAVWEAVRLGHSGVRKVRGVPGIPDGLISAAQVDVDNDFPGQLKNIPLCRRTAREAIDDSRLELAFRDRHRVGCSISGHMGDMDYIVARAGRHDLISVGKKDPWWEQWLPNSACMLVANDFGLYGPRLCNSTACASGTIAFLVAVRSILDDQCDAALAGCSQVVHPLFAAGFQNMRVLADHDDPRQACRPFDRRRTGFVMGEGAAMFVLERLSHALDRGADIYAEVLGGSILNDGRHVTNLDGDCDALVHLIDTTLRKSGLGPSDIDHINAHGTGTEQNDRMEALGIRRSLGPATHKVCVTANKSMLGHAVNASGGIELALTALALRDGFVPPTLNLTDPDPECDLDCVPLFGRRRTLQHALKLSIAFGGHLAAVALRRWNEAGERPSILEMRRAA